MSKNRRVSISKFLSLVLRHRPQVIGISLDPAGWVPIGELIRQCEAHGRSIRRADLDEVVATSDKRRFAVSEDGLRIRASQGHSVEVELGYEAAEPPAVLFHGTVAIALESIFEKGLIPMCRHHVHLSGEVETAATVGRRRGRPVILQIDAAAMSRAGHAFFRSANGVWLTERVPPEFLADEPTDPG